MRTRSEKKRRIAVNTFMMALAAALLLSGCTKEADDAGGTPADTAAIVDSTPVVRDTVAAPGQRPRTKEGTIMIEGNSEPIRLELFDSAPYSIPVPFITYIPHDFIVIQVPDAVGPAVHFIANFGGYQNANAWLQIDFLPAETNRDSAEVYLERGATADGRMKRDDAGLRYDWSLMERVYETRSGSSGRISLARHGDRFFFVQTEYPFEYADGFGPRARIIFDEWQWADTKSPGIGVQPSDQGVAPGDDTASITAIITRIERPADEGAGRLGTLIVENSQNPDTSSNEAHIMISPDTRIYSAIGRRPATFKDLKVGMRIRATYSGPILMIYPMRVTADDVVITR